jgi:hypothetical protein
MKPEPLPRRSGSPAEQPVFENPWTQRRIRREARGCDSWTGRRWKRPPTWHPLAFPAKRPTRSAVASRTAKGARPGTCRPGNFANRAANRDADHASDDIRSTPGTSRPSRTPHRRNQREPQHDRVHTHGSHDSTRRDAPCPAASLARRKIPPLPGLAIASVRLTGTCAKSRFRKKCFPRETRASVRYLFKRRIQDLKNP